MNEEISSPLVSLELLKKLRKEAKFTQTFLAEKLGISQEVLSRYESGKNPIPLEIAVKLIEQLGLGYQMMVGEPNRDFGPVDPGDPYRDYLGRLRLLAEFIHIEEPVGIQNDLNSPANLKFLVTSLGQLPRMVIAGRSDAGKSHVANSLIGEDILPTDYQPLTRIPIAIVHKDYQPAFVDTDCVMMCGSFDINVLSNESKFAQQYVFGGGRDILASRAIHNESDEESGETDWAVVFVDADILRACVIVDTPGFSASETDTDRAAEACRGAEILIYCSPVVNCLNPDDFVRLNHMLKVLPSPESQEASFPTFGNFLFVITHAGPQVSEEKLNKIRQKVSHRFGEHFREDIRKRNTENTELNIEERFVTFWSELESRYRFMREKIHRLLREDFPRYRMTLADQQISEFRENATDANKAKIDEWKSFLSRWEESKSKAQELEKKEPSRKDWVSKRRKMIDDSIQGHEWDSVGDYSRYYDEQVNPDHVEKLIRDHFSKQEEAQNEIAPLVLKRIQDHVARDLDKRSSLIAEQINIFLKDYSSSGTIHIDSAVDGTFAPGFDAVASFAGGVAGLAAFGALAVWAATLGNLGGYIIIAQVVGLLSAIGIPTGGVATVISAIAAMGGPVVFAIAIAIIAAITAFFWFSKSWQRRMSEKICDEFRKQGMQEKIKEQVQKYWRDTLIGFQTAADALERDWDAYLSDLKKIIDSDSKESIQTHIQSLERLNDFFARLPWIRFQKTLNQPREWKNQPEGI